MIRAIAGAATDVGRVRLGNEDSYLCTERLFFVADGMGGHSAGEVASAIAVTTLANTLADLSSNGVDSAKVADAVRTANTAIFEEAQLDSRKAGMGTTLTGIVLTDPAGHRAVVANVGDSRTYLWRHGELRQVTKDHSHVQSLVDRGAITRAEARVHFQRNIVLRAMGIDSMVDVDTFDLDIEDEDRFIICSDGLVDEADDDEIETQIRQASNPQDLADRLVALANHNGGRDNTTVVVVDFTASAADITLASPAATPSSPAEIKRPSKWLAIAAIGSWLISAAIVVTVVVSALTSG
ncbi:MAG: hypothetical protein RL391_980 [Actinomycetota bacterium]|jgi:protein phosphatase